ncbi:mammalian cell entry protein [Mycobacterium sp. GA-1841]|uniref:MCE family protein n=1 Tax=Mycobacterium sp. GA-1841 TaxID=1834154 RepID=UPI00096D4C05|nr:MCE family protein [Mycobacterium sp. GA-1841]OMC29376.1 mammalian cell entry protein [Mycobacterium sp. GA-1841]
MNLLGPLRRCAVLCSCALVTAGCSFGGLNSLPLPGADGRGSDAITYHIEVSNVSTLEPNSPVLLDDVTVGSVRSLRVAGWHADVEISVRPDVIVPGNVKASVGQTSLLGSMHLSLDVPAGQVPQARLAPNSTLSLNESTAYPTTERTLTTLSAVVNSGGLGQIGDIIHNFDVALTPHRSDARELLTNLNEVIGVFDTQQGDIVASIQALNRLAGELADQRGVITRTLKDVPPALDVLIAERPRITTALDKMRVFSDTTRGLIDDSRNDLVTTLHNLEPTVRALADVGPEIDTALAFLPVMPFGQNVIDRGIKGDYMNLFAVFDLTVPRLKRGLLTGTRWGDEHIHLVPAPGDPGYDAYYANSPLTAPLQSPPAPLPPAPAPPSGGG